MRLYLHIGIFLLVSLIAVSYSFSQKKKSDKKHCIQLVTVVMTLFSGLRSWRMGDVYHYCHAFIQCNSESWRLDFESRDSIGTQIIYRLFGQMGMGFEICLFVIAAFSAISLGYFVFRYSSSPYLSYLLYIGLGYYIFTMSALKQTIAMAFIMWAMSAIIESRKDKFLLFVILAALFHLPASIFLVAYFAAHKKTDKYYFIGLLVLTVSIMLLRDQIVSVASNLYYEDEVKYNAAGYVGGKFIAMLAMLIISSVIHPLWDSNGIYRYLFNIMVIATMLQAFSVYDNVFTRLADYYFQFSVVFVPLVLDSKLQSDYGGRLECDGQRLPRKMRVVAYLLISIAITMFYIQTLESNVSLLSEFRFFWEVKGPSSLELMGR